ARWKPRNVIGANRLPNARATDRGRVGLVLEGRGVRRREPGCCEKRMEPAVMHGAASQRVDAGAGPPLRSATPERWRASRSLLFRKIDGGWVDQTWPVALLNDRSEIT